MTTYPHSNPENGYAIRISKNLPKDAANLSYVHVDKPTPSKNINIKDYTKTIQENKASENKEIISAHLNDEGVLEVDQERFKSKTPHILITNEYANNIDETPLFYKYKSRKVLNVDNIEVSIPLSGNRLSGPKYIYQYKDGEDSRFVYEGEKVTITRSEGAPLERGDVFKVVLEKEAEGYYIVIYSAKELLDDGYEVYYPTKNAEYLNNEKEILNLKKVFTEETQAKDYLSKDNFIVVENEDNTFSVEIDKTEGNFLITEREREPYSFEYQIQSKVKTRLGEKNPLNVNIGFIYLNQSVFNATQTTSAMKKIVQDNPLMPDYLTFDNPHRRSEGINEKTNSEYWEASMNMPREHWLNYDVIIISGHGKYDIRRMNQNIRDYLSTGGILIVETASEKRDVLTFENNQITSVSFSSELTDEGLRSIQNELIRNRRYDIESMYDIGEISPTIQFLGEENESDWECFISQSNGSPSFIRKRTEDVGQLIYSNMGLMESILKNNTEATKLFVNMLIVILEERSFITPKYKEFVYHKDDLYSEEYETELGERIYFNDRSDEDRSQIIAKKIIEENINDRVSSYLPTAYRNWDNIEIKTKLFSEQSIKITNNRLNQSYGQDEFTATTPNAIPGFRYNSFSGDAGVGKHITNVGPGESSYVHVKTTNTHAFFEQEVGLIMPGRYKLEVTAKSQDTVKGGFGLYTPLGEPFAVEEITGTHDWRKIQLEFEVKESETLYLRLGVPQEAADSDIKFSEIYLTNKGSVRMNLDSAGDTPLYAYAISPKGKNNSLVAYEQTYSNPTILIENKVLKTTLRVKSFVYRWDANLAAYNRVEGNFKETEVSINTKDKEVILGNILEFIPALRSGVEWSRKQNVFYEIEIDDRRINNNLLGDDDFINISMYDPTIDEFFYMPDGRWVMNHNDIWWDSYNSTIQLKLSTDFYHLIATDNKYSVAYKRNEEFRTFLPYSKDERDRWYLRIRNGSFTKNTINASELEELKAINKEEQYDKTLIGEHLYEMPEYNRQTFYPYYGERLINEERALYVNPQKIEVASSPIVINEVDINKERLRPNSDSTVWSSQNIFWDSEKLPAVYLDQNNDGNMLLLSRGYKIDYREGKVILDTATEGTIYASYSHDNFKIYKRDFKNKSISRELLTTRDGYAFQLKNKNITITPAPKLYLGEPSKSTLMSPDRYWVDYEEGVVYFFDRIPTRVYADYSYFTEEELEYSDVNKNTGEIFLKERISFRDEIYVTYLVKDNTLEYKGYYDEELGRFISLDLNPSVGHRFDYILNGEVETLEGYDLLDKEIYVYLLPRKSTYYKTELIEENTVRHVFGQDEWIRIKEAQPTAILLTQLQVRENTNKDNIVIMDARKPGGGLKESVSDESIERRLGYTSAFWDIGSFDGLAYYRNGVMVIQIPDKVLEANGGQFTEDTVRSIIYKYIAYGTYPIIEFVEED